MRIKSQEFLYFHVPNEVADKNPRFGAHLKQMGKRAGIPDYVFIWKNGYGFLEFKKDEKTPLSDSQKKIRVELDRLSVDKYEVVWTVEQALETLIKWGILKGVSFEGIGSWTRLLTV